jgi:hypothetical protein
MSWTTEKPTNGGWYWKSDPDGNMIVLVFGSDRLMVLDYDDEGDSCRYYIDDERYFNTKWSGPIKEPEDGGFFKGKWLSWDKIDEEDLP